MELQRKILKHFKVPFTSKHLKEVFYTNPNRDNLLGYMQVLSYYGVDSLAYRLEKAEDLAISDLPCIAIYDEKLSFSYVGEGDQVFITDGRRQTKSTFLSFANHLGQMILLLERSSYYGEPAIEKHQRVQRKRKSLGLLAILLILGLAWTFSGLYTDTIFILLFGLLGGFLSLLLFAKAIDTDISYTICSIHAKANCDLHLNLRGLDLSELTFSFFCCCSVVSFLPEIAHSYTFLLFLGLSCPWVIWSIYYQIRQKTFCPLCVLISLCLAASLLATLISTTPLAAFNLKGLFIISMTYTLSLLFVEQLIRPLLERQKRLRDSLFQKNRLQEIAVHSASREPLDHPIDLDTAPADFCFGLPNDKTYLLIVNPLCLPCQHHLIQLKNILPRIESYQIKLIFNHWTAKQQEALHILLEALLLSASPMEIIYEWYSYGYRQTKRFMYRHKVNTISSRSKALASKHRTWCQEQSLRSSPIFLDQDGRLPKQLSITEFIRINGL